MENTDRYTLTDGKQHFYCELMVRGYSQITIEQYLRIIKEFHAFIQDQFEINHVDAIKPYHIIKFRSHLSKSRNTSGALIDKYFSCLKSYFSILEPRGVIDTNPTMNVDHKRLSKKNDKYTLSFDEVKSILKSKSKGLDSDSRKGKLIFLLILNGVFKREDVINIKVGDLDLSSKTLLLKDRKVVLSNSAIIELTEYLFVNSKKSNDYLISTTNNTKIGTSKYNMLFKSYVEDFNRLRYQSINESKLNCQMKEEIMENQKLTPTLLKRTLVVQMYKENIDEAAILRLTGLRDYSSIKRLK